MTCAPCLLATSVWLGSWLRGESAADDLVETLGRLAPDAPTTVLPEILGQLRRAGTDAVWWLSPRPGHTVGWPPGLSDLPEPAVLLSTGNQPVGLLRLGGHGWLLQPASGAGVPGLASEALPVRAAVRVFGEVVTACAARLEALGLDRAATRGTDPCWGRALTRLPRGLDPRAADLLHRIAALRDALDSALASDGAAVTAGEARQRSEALRGLADRLEDLASAVVGGLSMSPVAWSG